MTLKGFGYPDFQMSPHGYLPIHEDLYVTKANLRNLIETFKGERVMMPEYGADLDRHVFTQNTATAHSQIREAIIQAIEDSAPRIVVNEITVRAAQKDDLENETEYDHVIFIQIKFSSKFDLSVEEVLTVLFPAA